MARRNYDKMDLDELNAAGEDLAARRLKSDEEFKAERMAIQSARAAIEGRANAERLLGQLSDAEIEYIEAAVADREKGSADG